MTRPSSSASLAPGRLPAVIGLVEALRLLLQLFVLAFLGSTLAWFIGLAEQKSLGVLPNWSFSALGYAHGLGVDTGSYVFSLPATALVLLVWWLAAHGAARTRTAIAVNHVHGRPRPRRGGSAEQRFAAADSRDEVLGLGAYAATHLVVVVAASTLLGAAVLDWQGVLRALVLVVTSVVVGGRVLREPLGYVRRGLDRLPEGLWDTIVAGHFAARRVLWGLCGLGLLAFLAALVLNREAGMEMLAGYGNPVGAAIGLGLIQVAFAPTLWAFGLAWLSGGGIELASGTITSAWVSTSTPVIEVPALAMIPQESPAFSWAYSLTVVAVACGAIGLRRRWFAGFDLPVALATIAEVVLGILVIALFTMGGIGPAGLSSFGVAGWHFVAITAGEAVFGVVLGWLLTSLASRARA